VVVDTDGAQSRLVAAPSSAPVSTVSPIQLRARALWARVQPYKLHAPFLVVVFVAVNLLTINLTLPWGSTNEDNGRAFQTIAINHIRYGLAFTKGQDFLDTEIFNPHNAAVYGQNQMQYLLHAPVHPYAYGHHPPLLGLTVAAGFLIFGFHFWVVRMVPIVYSLAGLVLFYLLMLDLFDITIAAFASAIYAILPMFAYYGRDVAHEAPTLFWTLVMLTGYFHWLRDPRGRWLLLMAASVVVGGFYGWPMFYFSVILFAVHWLATRRFELKLALVTVLPCVLTFAAVIAQLAWAVGGSLAELIKIYNYRTGDTVDGASFTFTQWVVRLIARNAEGFGRWTQVLIPFATIFVLIQARVEGWSNRVRFAVLAFLFGIAHVLVFRQGAFVHIYWQFYFLPFYGLAFGWSGVALARRYLTVGWQQMGALVAMGCVLFALEWHVTQSFYLSGPHNFVPLVAKLMQWTSTHL
jgi:4-amino-4-deoxy-L-arabinose transferase-like glycosyltransferase